ncbi:Acyltransferase family protein [Streptomyces sp. Ag82_O1-12]|nr:MULTISPECIES: acyltransferase [unclassified Streptomyces]SMQ14269.1 Acyltransferase family protein [Streptomyces sp. Ag82_O1-12]SOD43295.1 Acyltransferase family protein [Streptomyces sp. Ag82_G6-1]
MTVAHAVMLQELLGTPNLLLVLWTLSYEMCFYLLFVALFTVRRHQRSAAVAVVFAVLAAGASRREPGCRSPPCRVRSATQDERQGSAQHTAEHPQSGRSTARSPCGRGLVVLAVMFLGTAVHRAEHGLITWRCAAGTAVLVVGGAVGSAYRYGDGHHFTRRGWIVAFLLAVLTFTAASASRHRRIPALLTGLGTISYSVYLVHPVLLAAIDGTAGRRRQDSLVHEVAFLAVLLPLCVLTHRYVETPAQAWGRRPAYHPGDQVSKSTVSSSDTGNDWQVRT